MLGFGEGGFSFGDGDSTGADVGAITQTDIDAFGGGWFNTMYDLMWNMAGAFAGLLLMIYLYYFRKR